MFGLVHHKVILKYADKKWLCTWGYRVYITKLIMSAHHEKVPLLVPFKNTVIITSVSYMYVEEENQFVCVYISLYILSHFLNH